MYRRSWYIEQPAASQASRSRAASLSSSRVEAVRMCSRSHRACFRRSAGFLHMRAAASTAVSYAFVCQLRYKRAFFLIFHNLSQVSCGGTIASLVTRARACAGRGTHPAFAWFSPSLVGATKPPPPLWFPSPFPLRFSNKTLFFLSKRGVFSGVRAVFSGCLVGVLEAWEGPFPGPLPFGGPEPGPSDGQRVRYYRLLRPRQPGPLQEPPHPGPQSSNIISIPRQL